MGRKDNSGTADALAAAISPVDRRAPTASGQLEHVSKTPAVVRAGRRPVTAPAADPAPGEKRKMTVSQRDISALADGLRDWLATRLNGQRPAISEVRMP